MRKLLLFLIATGAFSLLILAEPDLVLLGLIWGILPGLFLLAMPPLFFLGVGYGLSHSIWRRLVRPPVAAALSFTTAFGLSWFVAHRSASQSQRLFDEHLVADVVPSTPLQLSGDIAIQYENASPGLGGGQKLDDPAVACDVLCRSLLFSPQVRSVTVFARNQWSRSAYHYSIKPRQSCVGVVPLSASDVGDDLFADWTAKLGDRCIVADEERIAPDLTILIRNREFHPAQRWSGIFAGLTPFPIQQSLTEVRHGGSVLLRKSMTTTQKTGPILAIQPGGSKYEGKLEWLRFPMSTRSRYDQFRPVDELDGVTSIVTKTDRSAAIQRLRQQMEEALAKPSALTDAQLQQTSDAYIGALLRAEFESKAPVVTDADFRLIDQLVRSRRIRSLEQLPNLMYQRRLDVHVLRPAIDERLDRSNGVEDAALIRQLDRALGAIPDAQFAKQTPIEARLVGDRQRIVQLPTLIRKQWARGPSTAPLFEDLLEEALVTRSKGFADSRKQAMPNYAVIQAAAAGLCQLGGSAPASLATIEGWERRGLVSPHLAGEDWWIFMLARLGRPVDQFRKPDNMSGTQERYEERLRAKLSRFDRSNPC